MNRVQIILRILLGVTFLFSGYTKFVAPGFFEITLMDQGLAPSRFFAAQLARLFIGLEFALGILILFPFYTKQLMLISIVLLGSFTGHLIYLWAIGDSENCGCFGEMISMTPGESILKNLVLIAVSFFLHSKIPKDNRSLKIPVLIGLGFVLSMWAFLPIPNHRDFPFQSFTHFESEGRVDLATGEKTVAVFNLDCEHCQEAAKKLGILYRKNLKFPKLYLLFYQEGSTTVSEFESLTQASFPYAYMDVNMFFDLRGNSPPRIYYLREGKAEVIWDKDLVLKFQETFELK